SCCAAPSRGAEFAVGLLAITQIALVVGAVLACVYQLWRTPRIWAFVFLFIVVFPKIPLIRVPGETTPIRVDDVVIAAVLGGWLLRLLLARRKRLPPAPATPYLLLFALVAIVTSLLGIATGSTTPSSAALHFLRRVQQALLYYYFFRAIGPEDLPAV